MSGKVAVSLNGDIIIIPCPDDFHSGYNEIETGKTVTIKEDKQTINFTMLTLDGTLNLEGDLWLA